MGCFALNALSYVPFIWVALWILPRGKRVAKTKSQGEDPPLFQGVREVARTPYLRGALITVLLTSTLCGPLIVFCPVLVQQVMHGDVSDFSIDIGAFGVGGLLGAVALLGVDVRRDRRHLSSWFAAGYGLILILTALNPWPWGLTALFVCAGVAMSVSNTSANALLQATTFADLRGQTISLYMLAMRGGISVGSLVTGLSVSLLGAREALLINGAIALVAQVAVGRDWFRSPLPKFAAPLGSD